MCKRYQLQKLIQYLKQRVSLMLNLQHFHKWEQILGRKSCPWPMTLRYERVTMIQEASSGVSGQHKISLWNLKSTYIYLPWGHESEAVNKNNWKKQGCLAVVRRSFSGHWYLHVMQCHAGHNAPYSRRAKILHKVALFYPDIIPSPAHQTLYHALKTLWRRK